MSRRAPNPAAERAAQNQQTIKTLLKLEGNKSCADCKRNKHPRWASWNLGIFICIRCSGIHRGMGTHISRVKSVDLDAWTDEQLQSVLRWGNSRANKYWESKLAPGHVPSDAKIENFIRTKYEAKRWVMDGQMPDPSTLDADGDDDVPLNVVQEKAKMERSSSQRLTSTSSQPAKSIPKPAPTVDLFGDIPTPPARPSTTDTPNTRNPPPKATGPPKQQKQGDSLLGLDFFGGPLTSSAKPAGASSIPGSGAAPSRPDLKQSILSLYASAPRTQSQPQQDSQDIFGGMQSPTTQNTSTSGGLDDAFSGLNFATTSPPPSQTQASQKSDPFASFGKPSTQRSSFTSASITSPPPLSGGGFFDTGTKPAQKPANAPKPTSHSAQPLRTPSASNGLGDFSFASTTTMASKPPPSSASNDLFDFSDPLPSQSSITSKPAPQSSNLHSAFNLSAPAPHSQPATKSAPVAPVSSNAFSGFANDDPWGSSNAWATPEPSAASKPKIESKSPAITTTNDFSSWGNSGSASNAASGNTFKEPPKIAADEDFGGWNSAAPETPAVPNPPPQSSNKPVGGGFGASEDLFSNVWG